MLTMKVLYEMEQARQNLENEIEHQRQVRTALQARDNRNGRFLDKVQQGWHFLSQLRHHRIRITLEPKRPCPDSAPHQA